MDLYWYSIEVLRVIDGDTVRAVVDLGFDTVRKMNIRLLGINAPELDTKAGRAAKDRLEQLVLLPGLLLKSDRDRSDKYGNRWLGTLYRDGVSLNQQLLDEGHAVPYRPR